MQATRRRVLSTLTPLFLLANLSAQEGHPPGECPTGAVYRGEFDCLRVPVFENRETGDGRQISLHVVILPALGDDVAPDPVFVLMGGPGQAAADKAGYFADYLAPVREHRDLVFVDARGTGDSNPLDFEIGAEDLLDSISDPFPLSIVKRELEKLKRDSDLTQYTTDNLADDLDDVRDYLGYEQINLWGASYGTRFALVYLRRHEERCRSVVIKAVAPLGFAVGARFAKDAQASLDQLFENYAADPRCTEAYGNVREKFEGILADLAVEPVPVEVRNPLNGERVEIQLTPEAIALTVHTMLYVVPEHAVLPGMIARAAEGDFREWGEKTMTTRLQGWQQIFEGMFLSVLAAEDRPLLANPDPAHAAKDSFLGSGFLDAVNDSLAVWPGATLGEAFWEPVRSEVPVLVISGELDPVTPEDLGAEAAAHLPNSLHLVFPGGSHGDSAFRPCLDGVYAEFYSEGSVADLDTSCAENGRTFPVLIR